MTNSTRPKLREPGKDFIQKLREHTKRYVDAVEEYERPIGGDGKPDGPDFESESYMNELHEFVMESFYGEGFYDWMCNQLE